MFSENLKKFYQLSVRNMRAHCRRAIQSRAADAIHEMRVENKRLRGLFRLVGAINPGFRHKMYFSAFRDINRNSSMLRDAHVQLDLLDGLKNELDVRLDGFRLFLLEQEHQGWKNFLSFAGDGSLSQLRSPALKLSQALISTSEARFEAGVQQRVKSMNSQLIELHHAEDIDEVTMHEVRTVSKELYFTILIGQQCLEMYQDQKNYLDALGSVHKALGKWHDYDVCLDLIEDYLVSMGEHVPLADYYRLKELTASHRFKHHRSFETAFSAFVPLAQRL